ncbi:connector enhancer of kinase suppressor of ras 1 isoform 2-T2 [Anomaloglossus baeobatrachus]|uniref:connector enhancer of kinase suppressor of ras 1 isoform X2 n=1 Tax=Anomaloglossus baeobatrachus TaxID=238106 RepID=UPI003F50C17D
MELISSWSPDTVSGYLEGLDPTVQHYPFQGWSISGQNLLDLSPQHLDALGVRSIGHQEIFLEAVEQLCALHYELHSETLRSLTDKLYGVSQSLSSHILLLRKASSLSQALALSPTQKQLACIIDIISAARGLFSWLNRYLFTRLNDYSASRDVIALCVELAELLHKDWSDLLVENRILAICDNICGICRSILSCSPESLLGQTAALELVQIYPESSSSLGIELKSTSSGQHFICRIAPETPAQHCGQIFPGDEIIKVNDQVVVGWTQKNLVLKLQERPSCVDIVLKKVTISQSKSSSDCPSKKKPHKTRTSSTPSSSLLTDIPTSPTKHVASLKVHKSLLPAYSVPTIHSRNPLISLQPEAEFSSYLEHLETTSPSTKHFSDSNQHLSSESFSPIHNTWPSSGTSSHGKLPVSILFHSATSQPSEDLNPHKTMSSTIYAKTLTPISQISPELNPQELRDVSRPRSGSDSCSQSQSSLLSVPLSPGALRSSVSESNLSNATNVAVFGKDEIQGQEDSIKNSQTTSISPKSLQADKKPQKSPNIDKRAPGRLPQSQKGTVTKLSRRRVSCKDLRSPDCDGWLWKRKENVSFMSQKWKRCWCVLKKDRLYWYSSPQEEKALGLLNISVYSLEKPPETKSKKKYEFQLSHPTYKTFVFAADKLTDMEMWLTFLLKMLQKYKAPQSSSHSQEEDCYSETEAEDDEHQARSHDMVKKPVIQSPSKNITGSKIAFARDEGAEGGHSPKSSIQPLKQSPVKNMPEAIQVIPCEEGAEGVQAAKSTDDDLHMMMTCLKQGGVSLIGKKTAMTRDEYRKSFIRRNKNPEINHKAHSLRVLQSTLKAKLMELQSLNQVLENPDLNSTAFQKWKSEHEHLYGVLGQSPQAQRAVTGNNKKTDKSSRESRESDESD